MNEARITALRAELRAIHLADMLYWAKGARADRADRAEYRLRQNRLLEIRCELDRRLWHDSPRCGVKIQHLLY